MEYRLVFINLLININSFIHNSISCTNKIYHIDYVTCKETNDEQ